MQREDLPPFVYQSNDPDRPARHSRTFDMSASISYGNAGAFSSNLLKDRFESSKVFIVENTEITNSKEIQCFPGQRLNELETPMKFQVSCHNITDKMVDFYSLEYPLHSVILQGKFVENDTVFSSSLNFSFSLFLVGRLEFLDDVVITAQL